jgi:hypoxanthine phosphoribosyltransferase
MKILLKPKAIEFETKILAKQISDHHIEDKSPIVFICLLNGGFMFFSDLVKKCTFDFECDFMRVKSYSAKKKQGDIQIKKDLETSIKGKHVYLIDDIYDTGNTMNAVIDYLQVKKPKTISIATLITRTNSPTPEQSFYNAFVIGDEDWCIGYGMDGAKKFNRNLPSVYAL